EREYAEKRCETAVAHEREMTLATQNGARLLTASRGSPRNSHSFYGRVDLGVHNCDASDQQRLSANQPTSQPARVRSGAPFRRWPVGWLAGWRFGVFGTASRAPPCKPHKKACDACLRFCEGHSPDPASRPSDSRWCRHFISNL